MSESLYLTFITVQENAKTIATQKYLITLHSLFSVWGWAKYDKKIDFICDEG